MSKLNIVMYHYVRPIINSEYPGIKGLELDGFKRQLDYLENNYCFVTANQVNDAILKKKKLPSNACWLTFDDGFKDHINYVVPELLKRNISAAFFPPSDVITDNISLNVHLIQHILSCSKSFKSLVLDLNSLCKQHGISEHSINSYYKKYAMTGRYDEPDVVYVKRMLQHVLPEQVQNEITSALFTKYLGVSKSEFSNKLYMNIEDLSKLIKCGMYVGSHGARHYWLNKISEEKQREDIKSSLEFLEEIGTPTSDWIMCYPFGGYNDSTLSIVKEYGGSIGLTTKVGAALIGKVNPLTLPRFDTNDFPQ